MNKRIRVCMTIFFACIILFGLSACQLLKGSSGKTQVVHANVIEIEKYGHAVLDLTTAEFCAAGYELGDVVNVCFDAYEAEMPFFDGYYVTPGEVMLRGTATEENIALCINYGEFTKETGIAIGDTVEITLAKKAGMLALQELCALQYSNDRADYSDDAAYANFREVTVGSIGEGKLYRSASPISQRYNRAAYVDNFLAMADVATVLNLSDSTEDIEAFCKEADFVSENYRTLYEAGNVIALDLAGNFFADQFSKDLVEGLCVLIQKEPPYCIHCMEGKDRTGFAIMLLEAVMGAELEEIIDDYMLSFYNYYGIDKETESERYEAVLNNNLVPILCYVTGADSMETLAQMDLSTASGGISL